MGCRCTLGARRVVDESDGTGVARRWREPHFTSAEATRLVGIRMN